MYLIIPSLLPLFVYFFVLLSLLLSSFLCLLWSFFATTLATINHVHYVPVSAILIGWSQYHHWSRIKCRNIIMWICMCAQCVLSYHLTCHYRPYVCEIINGWDRVATVLALYPGRKRRGKSGLVPIARACTNYPKKTWGSKYHHLFSVFTSSTRP